MEKNTLLSAALALSSVFAPLKAQPKDNTPKIDPVNISTNAQENYSNYTPQEIDINGTPFLIYDENNLPKTKARKIQPDLKELLEESDRYYLQHNPRSDKKNPILDEELKKILSGNFSPKPIPPQKDLQDLLSDLSDGNFPKEQAPAKTEVASTVVNQPTTSPVPDKKESMTEEPQKPIVASTSNIGTLPKENAIPENPSSESLPTSSLDTNEALAKNSPTPLRRSKNDDIKELLDLLDKEGQPKQTEGTPSSNDDSSEKIAFWAWLALMGSAAAVQGKKYLSKKGKKDAWWPEEGPFPWDEELIKKLQEKRKSKEKAPNNTEEEIFTTNDPLSPFSPIDLQNYLTETISPDLIQSVLKKKQEGIKLLPYHPVELTIEPAKDPLSEKDREILAKRLMALKSISEIQKERAVLTRMMAKARRQDDKKAIDKITARREVLSEKMKKARLTVIGNQLDSIRKQRHDLTRKITLAKRKHDRWQIDSVQRQRATLKAKEKTVKGFIRSFSYADYRHQWHTQRKQSRA